MMATAIQALSPLAIPRAASRISDLEEELVRRAQRGDQEAFEQLIYLHGRAVLRLTMRMTNSHQDANDAYQNTFLKALTAIKSFRGQCAFRTWLYRIASNFCIAILRERTGRISDFSKYTTGTSEPIDISQEFVEGRPLYDPEHHLLSDEVGNRIAVAIKKLTARERVIFQLKHFEELKLQEIACILSTTEGTVKNTLFRATQKLRYALQDLR
jgi:RNA polymerase sigma-70 factor, ECF subfamily